VTPPALFYDLAAKVESARTAAELGFVICNHTRALVDYRQAALVTLPAGRRPQLVAHSGLADLDTNTPYALWLSEVARRVRGRCAELPPTARVLALSPELLDDELVRDWAEWLPGHVWILPLAGPDGEPHALLLLARDAPWPTALAPDSGEFTLLQLAALYGYAWWAVAARPSRLQRWWRAGTMGRRARQVALGVLLALLIPVKQYTLVPAEVISTRSEVIAAPQDGVIHRMAVPPNTPVKAGQVLAELDDTTLRNRLAVAQAELATARIAMHQASQEAIESQSAKAELSIAEGKWRERGVDVAALEKEIGKLAIRAPADGVFVYSDPDDWVGRPVQTGERVGLIADPATLGVRAWAPVGEPTNLDAGAPITLFLRVAPLHPVAARLDYAGYQPVEAPNGVASYVVRGTIAHASPEVRIGLQGTARIAGRWSVLGYLLLRRPLASMRAWLGV